MAFGITYGGLPLLVPSPSLSQWVDDNLDLDDEPSASHGWPHSELAGLSHGYARQPRPATLNMVHWPAGASRYGIGRFLADSDTVDAIRLLIAGSGDPANPYGVPLPLTLTTSTGSVRFERMYLLPPRPIQFRSLAKRRAVHAKLANPYILTFVDDRYWWHFASMLANESDSGSGEPDGPQDGSNFTNWDDCWDWLTQALAHEPGITAGGLTEEALLAPSNQLLGTYDSIPIRMDAAAWATGKRFGLAYDGTGQLLNPKQWGTLWRAYWDLHAFQRVAGGGYETSASYSPLGDTDAIGLDRSRVLPRKVVVGFDLTRNHCPTGKTIAGVVHLEGGAAGVRTFRAGELCIDQDDSGSGGADSGSGTNPSAQELADDYAEKIGAAIRDVVDYAQLDVRLAGIVPFPPDGLHDVTFSYRHGQLGGCYTEIRPAMPWFDGVTRLQASDPKCRLTIGCGGGGNDDMVEVPVVTCIWPTNGTSEPEA